jgi:hypothetical protein
VALLSDERTGPPVLARPGAAQHLLHCTAMTEPRHGAAALPGAVHSALAALSEAQRCAMRPTSGDVDAALDTVRSGTSSSAITNAHRALTCALATYQVADASAPTGATGVAASLLACWCGSQAHVIAQRPRAAHALSSALASLSKARAWHQAAQVADTLAAVAAHEPYRIASHSQGAQALRDAALAALSSTTTSDTAAAAAADAVATGVACTQALTLALDGRSGGEEPLYSAALSAVLPALASSPALHTVGAVGTAAAKAVGALHEAGGLDWEARSFWLPLLLAWAAPRTTSALPVSSSLSPGDDEHQSRVRQQACVAALTGLVSGHDAAAAWVAHAWLAFMLRALAADTAGWAPRIVADDAAAAANTAAAALDGVVAAAAARSGHLALSSAAPPRRLYGLLPPATPAMPPRPTAPPGPLEAAATPPSGDYVPGTSPPPLATGLKALALVLTTEPGLCTAALASGVLPLLARLTTRAELAGAVETEDAAPSPPHPAVQRQLARVLAHLAQLPAAAPVVGSDPFASWLRGVLEDYSAEVAALQGQGLPSATRKLASHARRAMLNAEAVMRSMQDGGDAAPASPLPRFGDGLFFFQPGSETAGGQGCVLDVVFIHGLRGGPFGTWRTSPAAAAQGGASSPREHPRPGAPQHATPGGGKPRRRQRQGRPVTVWPADWLPSDMAPAGGMRLLSLSFRSRYSDWEGTTQGLDALADGLLEKLTSAGVGARPCVLVGHSMGGVLIKLMLLRASQEPRHEQLASSLRGAVFYSCPHFGSALAAYGAWRVLRLAPGVTALKPGTPSLESLNDHLRRLHKRAQGPVRVLSFLEGAPTTLAELPVPGLKGRAIAAEIVAAESAYPGFGDLVVLPQCDHIDACKPRDREEANYKRTLELIQAAAREAAAQLMTQEQETPTNS